MVSCEDYYDYSMENIITLGLKTSEIGYNNIKITMLEVGLR